MSALATLTTVDAVLPVRVRYRQEMNCQIVHDSIHRRDGWTRTYVFTVSGAIAGFGSVAIAGPWQDKPTVFEFYVLPEHRARVFDLFEACLSASGARFMEVQSSDALLTVMLHGSYLVQELKRLAYELGSVPCARCSSSNIASRKTLQKAGLVPYAHILNGSIRAD